MSLLLPISPLVQLGVCSVPDYKYVGKSLKVDQQQNNCHQHHNHNRDHQDRPHDHVYLVISLTTTMGVKKIKTTKILNQIKYIYLVTTMGATKATSINKINYTL